MKYNLFLTLVSVAILISCNSDIGNTKPFEYPIELKFLSRIDTVKNDTIIQVNSSRHFLLKEDSWKDLKDSAFIRYLDTMNKQGVSQANYLFYKKSGKTNEKNLIANPRDLDRYSQLHDLLLVYIWSENQHKWFIFKYKDGQIISAGNNINVTDIK